MDESAAEMDSLMQMPEIKFGAGALGGQIPVQEVDPFKNGTYVAFVRTVRYAWGTVTFELTSIISFLPVLVGMSHCSTTSLISPYHTHL